MKIIEEILTYNLKPFILTGITFILFLLGRIIIFKLIKKRSIIGNISSERVIYIRKITHFMLFALFLTILGAIWEISLQGLSLYFVSIFTVVGVALFATWSVLSNLTTSVLLFFFFPYRIGQTIRIIDGDNSIEGIIKDFNLFHIKIKTEDDKIVAYPNSLAIQKPIKISTL